MNEMNFTFDSKAFQDSANPLCVFSNRKSCAVYRVKKSFVARKVSNERSIARCAFFSIDEIIRRNIIYQGTN